MSDAAWTPRTFAVGERVRVKLSAECQYKGQVDLWQRGRWVPESRWGAHPPEVDGAEGTVTEVHDTPHGYVVEFPSDIWSKQWGWVASVAFAGAELAPLDAAEVPQ